MSKMEYNKGKLILVSSDVPCFAEHCIKELDTRYYESKEEQFTEQCMDNEDYVILGDKVYIVEWESRSEDLDEIARATVNSDGTIAFETYHYNGGAHWTEVVEYALKRNKIE